MTLLPLPPERWSFTHMPPWISSPPLYIQYWAWALGLHFQIWILVRSAKLLPVSSMHLPAYPLNGW